MALAVEGQGDLIQTSSTGGERFARCQRAIEFPSGRPSPADLDAVAVASTGHSAVASEVFWPQNM
jgi:hypothetical protein